MVASCRRILKYTGAMVLLLLLIQLHIIVNKPWYKFKLMRLQVMITLQLLLSYGSVYLHRTYAMSPLLKKLTIVVIGLTHFSFIAQYIFIGENPSCLTTIPFLAQAVHLFMLMGTFAGDVGTYLFIPFTLKISINYQKFKQNSVPIAAVILTIWSYINTLLPPQHTSVEIPIRGLGKEFNNLHIMHLSDIHTGPTTGKAFVDYMVDRVNEEEPDLVLITGDLVDSSVKNLKGVVRNLKNMKTKYGIFYVTGNHEYYTNDVDNWLNYLETLSIHTLHNRHHVISSGNASLCVAGVDDPQAEKMNYEGHKTDPVLATAGCPPDTPIIMLAHQPKAAKISIDTLPRVDLVLSGHTHGGQFFPIHIPVWLANPYFAGLYHPRADTHVFVSRGLRFYGAPIRLFSFPEFTSVFLKTKKLRE